MKNVINQAFHSGKFLVGFIIFACILVITIVYPIIVRDPPLAIIGKGTFFEPGLYVSAFDGAHAKRYSLSLDKAEEKRIAVMLGKDERREMKAYLLASGIAESAIDTQDSAKLLELWERTYDPDKEIEMTSAKRNYYIRLDASLKNLLGTEGVTIAESNPDTGALEASDTIQRDDFVNVGQIPVARWLPLGTDNFGRDMLTELVSATRTSLLIGFVAGSVATLIGLLLGLMAGYIGGRVDDFIMFITNLFTVIPSFVLLILISFSIGQEKRGAFTIAVVIGLTSWVWTARAVRAQVFSLRNRDHVNLSKLSGHSTARIIARDILPYVASYVVMALILQISSAILAEAGLSIFGLGPKTTEVPTLGLMMNWAMIYSAHVTGKWWAYMPVLLDIALITFSMNLMNTGLDQVFNPTLRD
jgi:ABC-type dipeptide/oligopeptide/nickel transport systems, permease components